MSSNANQIQKKHIAALDFIRTIAALFVVCVHVITITPGVEPHNLRWWSVHFGMSLFLSCNGIFFMLAGFLSCQKNYPDVASIRKYYLSRLIKLGIPFVFYSLVCYFWYNDNYSFTNACAAVLYRQSTGTVFWFMYTLFGFIVASPFLSRLLSALDDTSLWYLLAIAFLFNAVSVYAQMAGGTTPVSFWISGWLIYYIAGYCSERLKWHERKIWIPLSMMAIGFGITMVQKYFSSSLPPYINDIAPTMMLSTVGLYILLRKVPVRAQSKLGSFCAFIGKYSISIYMIHWEIRDLFLYHAKGFAIFNNNPLLASIYGIIAVFIVSLLVGFVIDNVILTPLSRLAEHLINRSTRHQLQH